ATCLNLGGDRRFLQSDGPFTFEAGSVEYITVGVVWARTAAGGGPIASVDSLKLYDNYILEFYDSCFSLSTAVNELMVDENSVSVYPNPFSEETTIHFNNPKGNEFSASFFDMKGN